MVFHWPEPGGVERLAASMREFGDVLTGTPGLLSVEPPHVTEDGECLVGISKWESEEAFRAAVTLRADEGAPRRPIPLLGLAGCLLLAATLPARSVLAGLAVFAVGTVLWLLRRRSVS